MPGQIRKRAEELGMYVEVACLMPKADDRSEFEAIVRASKEAGRLHALGVPAGAAL